MAALQVEGHDGVRVMTVHAAKGLEFPVVAVADLGRGLGAGSRAPDIAIGRLQGEVGDPPERPSGCGCRSPRANRFASGSWSSSARPSATPRSRRRAGWSTWRPRRAQERLILSGSYSASDLEAAEEPKARAQRASSCCCRRSARAAGRGATSEVELPRAPAIGGGEAGRPQRRDHGAECSARPPSAPPSSAAALPEPPGALNGALPHAQRALLADRPRRRGRRPPLLLGARRLRAVRLPVLRRARARGRVAARRGAGRQRRRRRKATSPRRRTSSSTRRSGPRERSLAIGNAVHAALEWSARHAWA